LPSGRLPGGSRPSSSVSSEPSRRNSYALPTKDANLKRLSLTQIHANIAMFAAYARQNPTDIFIMTAIGTGLAGYSEQEIGELFFMNNLPENVFISAKLFNIL
jgi:hypothetical protein